MGPVSIFGVHIFGGCRNESFLYIQQIVVNRVFF